jgi:hypothetical protein
MALAALVTYELSRLPVTRLFGVIGGIGTILGPAMGAIVFIERLADVGTSLGLGVALTGHVHVQTLRDESIALAKDHHLQSVGFTHGGLRPETTIAPPAVGDGSGVS